MGLLLSHISTVSIWNDLVVVSTPIQGERAGGGQRKEIYGFSAESRKRLIEKMHKLEFERATFVTLTYPAEFPHDWKVYKRHLQAFRKAIERLAGKIGIIWRLEYQKRGAPHYHLILLDPPFINVKVISEKWYKIVGSGDANHLLNGLDLKPVSEWGDKGLVAHYVAKYTSKIGDEVEEHECNLTGRHWGCWNIKEKDPIKVAVETWQAQRIATVLFSNRRCANTWRPIDYSRSTILGDNVGGSSFGEFALRVIQNGELTRE